LPFLFFEWLGFLLVQALYWMCFYLRSYYSEIITFSI